MDLASYLSKNEIKPAQFASDIGVPASTISRILSGERSPRFDTILKIVEGSNGEVTVDDFIPSERAA